MKIGIGIDTGGTYTDAVAYDFAEKTVLGSSKALTTYHDLSEGILGALDALDPALVKKAELIALSTTLATNACVEGKGGNAKLIFIDVAASTVADVGPYYGLPRKKNMLFLKSEDAARWDLGDFLDDADAVAVVGLYAMKNNAIYEKKCRDLALARRDLPLVCGHELFSDLNAVQRGASALLNARLFPVIERFLVSIHRSLALRGVAAPVVIMRSDATLMSEEFTNVRPVETLLCGPAASALGAMELAGEPDCVIVDMGGTTTDISIVEKGQPVKSGGVRVGSWRTFVKGLHIDTFGLGGDSRVFHKNNKLVLHETRAVPLCVLASAHEGVVPKLRALVNSARVHTLPLHEFIVLALDPGSLDRFEPGERVLIEALRKGPLIWEDAAEAMGVDPYALKPDHLVRQGIVNIAGLTPTDIMHLRGDFTTYHLEAAELGARYIAMCTGMDSGALAGAVYHEVKRKLFSNIARILLERYNPHYQTFGLDDGANRLIHEAYDMAARGESIAFLARTSMALVGVGAPIHVFLPDVAKAFGTKCRIPDHAAVANAVGAVVGKIQAAHTTEIQPDYGVLELNAYVVYGTDKNVRCDTLEEAIEAAKRDAKGAVTNEVRSRGALGELHVDFTVEEKRASAVDSSVYLGTFVTAAAVGQAK